MVKYGTPDVVRVKLPSVPASIVKECWKHFTHPFLKEYDGAKPIWFRKDRSLLGNPTLICFVGGKQGYSEILREIIRDGVSCGRKE